MLPIPTLVETNDAESTLGLSTWIDLSSNAEPSPTVTPPTGALEQSISDSSASWIDLGEPQVNSHTEVEETARHDTTAQHDTVVPQSASSTGLGLEVCLEHAKVLAPKDGLAAASLGAVISVVAPCAHSTRVPVALVAVIDRSGSMSGAKLKMTLKTLRFVLSQLREVDSLGIVSYSSDVRVQIPLTLCNDMGKQQIESALRSIRADGQTNLSGGLLRGIEMHREAQNSANLNDNGQDCIRSVFLLTDGMANMGITGTEELGAATQATLVELHPHQSVSVHCFGYGPDHNATMLRLVAQKGGGGYFYIQNDDMIASKFADALGGLLSMVMQNATLRLVSSCASLQTGLPVSAADCGEHTVELGDLFAEERRDILVEFDPLALADKSGTGVDTCIGEVSVRGFSLVSNSWQQKGPIAITTQVIVGDVQPYVAHPSVARHRNRFMATQAMEAALRAADRGQLRRARNFLTQALREIKETVPFQSEDALTLQLVAQLRDCRQSMCDEHQYDTIGSKTLTSCTMEHTMQSHGSYMNTCQEEVSERSIRWMAAPG